MNYADRFGNNPGWFGTDMSIQTFPPCFLRTSETPSGPQDTPFRDLFRIYPDRFETDIYSEMDLVWIEHWCEKKTDTIYD